MKLARVIGTVVATRSAAGMQGFKLLVVQPLGEDREPAGRAEIAADATAQAGPGQLVFTVASREGAQAMPELFVPVDLAITGLVDDVHLDGGARRCEPSTVWRREG